MNWSFILAQLAGLVALAILILSFRERAMAKLLKLQIFSSLAYALQYFLLGAYAGMSKCLACVVRNFIFSRFNKRRPPLVWLGVFLLIAIIFAVLTYAGPISLLPAIAFAIYTVAAWSTRVDALKWAEIISCLLFIVYNIHVSAYTGLLATIVELVGVVAVAQSAAKFVPKQAKRKKK